MRKKSYRNIFILLICLMASGEFSCAQAAPVIYDNFKGATGLTLNGSATIATDRLRLTNTTDQNGSAFLTSPIALKDNGSFSTSFQFQISNSSGGSGGGDGFTFVLQDKGPTAVGSGGMGYSGITPSIAIEFDTYLNQPDKDPNNNHIGVDLNGSTRSVTTANIANSFKDGKIWNAWIDYNSTKSLLEVRVSETTTMPKEANLTYSIYLPNNMDMSHVWAGFTGGTSRKDSSTQEILNWTFYDTYHPVPISSAIYILGSGLLGLLGLRRIFHRNN